MPGARGCASGVLGEDKSALSDRPLDLPMSDGVEHIQAGTQDGADAATGIESRALGSDIYAVREAANDGYARASERDAEGTSDSLAVCGRAAAADQGDSRRVQHGERAQRVHDIWWIREIL